MAVLARPYIVLRNDQQDALGAGLAVTEYALDGKSAEKSAAFGVGSGASSPADRWPTCRRSCKRQSPPIRA
jgi:hypothetical protein